MRRSALAFMFYAVGLGVLTLFTLIGIGALCKPGHDAADNIMAVVFGVLLVSLAIAGALWVWGYNQFWRH